MVSPRVARLLTEAMLKHLPPSASQLSLLDVEGKASDVLLKHRPDLDITRVEGLEWHVPPGAFDAVTAFDDDLRGDLLESALNALRPGGRLIIMSTVGDPNAEQVRVLENHGFTRILVETGAECPLPVGVLMRGEKPHATDDTHARIKVAADRAGEGKTLENFGGRYVYLLIRQQPNKPAWAVRADETVTWDAITINGALIAFSSLPNAVAFMQPVVVAGAIKDVSKFAKFKVGQVKSWSLHTVLNPPIASLDRAVIGTHAVDPNTAEAPDE